MNGCAVQTEQVISHILEIIYIMTGEEYMIVKKPPMYKCFPQMSEDLCQTRNSVLKIPVDSPVHVRRSQATRGMLGEAQKEPLDSAFQPPPDGTHVQIKCDDVAMYLSVEEWEYLEHHKEEYEVMIGQNQPSPADGPNWQRLQEGYNSQLYSEQRDCDRNDTVKETNLNDWNTENMFAAPKLSYIRVCENNSSPKRESSNKIYEQKPMTVETWGSTESRDVSALQNNPTLNHEPLSGLFLETEIKEEQTKYECVMNDCTNTAVTSNNSDHMDSPSLTSIQKLFSGILQETCSHDSWSTQESLLGGNQINKVNVTDSSVDSNYNLDFSTQTFSEKRQQLPILNGHQTKMAEFIDPALLNNHTLDHLQRPFADVAHRKHVKKGLTNKRCSIVGQETKSVEVSDISLEADSTLSIINLFKDLPQITHTRTEVKKQECSIDGAQAETVDIKDCRLEKNATESISKIFQNVFEKAHIKRKPPYQACSLDGIKEGEINDSLLEDSNALYQLSNSFSDDPQRTCIKTELIHHEHSRNGHQKKTKDIDESALGDSHILGCSTSPLNSHGKRKLTYQECSMRTQQTKMVEVHHPPTENSSSFRIDWQTNNKPSTHLDYHYFAKEPVHDRKNTIWQSTGRVQPSSKPLKMISCLECGKMFSCNSYLLRHQRLHTGEKPFTCSECGKSFSWMSSLVTHKRTHFGEKPFSCKQCGKRFSDYSGIIKHRRSHTGEKPYSCLLCGERFAQTYQLVKHQAVHLVDDAAEKSLEGQ